MKVEFLNDISDGGRFPHADPNQLVRLYGFDNLQARLLRHSIQNIIIKSKKDIDLTTLDFIQDINCNLTLQISDTDKGITTSDNKNFVCDLTIEKYKEMVFLMEPFCEKETNGYQLLYDLDTPIRFLFSPIGTW